jgi:hypothetical protein
MADETGNHEETQNTRVSRREAFGLGSAALAAALAVAGTKQASGAPQTLKPTAVFST